MGKVSANHSEIAQEAEGYALSISKEVFQLLDEMQSLWLLEEPAVACDSVMNTDQLSTDDSDIYKDIERGSSASRQRTHASPESLNANETIQRSTSTEISDSSFESYPDGYKYRSTPSTLAVKGEYENNFTEYANFLAKHVKEEVQSPGHQVYSLETGTRYFKFQGNTVLTPPSSPIRHTSCKPKPYSLQYRSRFPLYQRRGSMQLWQFLILMLDSPRNSTCIIWTGRGLEFKLLDPEEVARKWGIQKNRPAMNYDKLSRSLRYYYEKGLLQKVAGERYVYRFICEPETLFALAYPKNVPSPTIKADKHNQLPATESSNQEQSVLELSAENQHDVISCSVLSNNTDVQNIEKNNVDAITSLQDGRNYIQPVDVAKCNDNGLQCSFISSMYEKQCLSYLQHLTNLCNPVNNLEGQIL